MASRCAALARLLLVSLIEQLSAVLGSRLVLTMLHCRGPVQATCICALAVVQQHLQQAQVHLQQLGNVVVVLAVFSCSSNSSSSRKKVSQVAFSSSPVRAAAVRPAVRSGAKHTSWVAAKARDSAQHASQGSSARPYASGCGWLLMSTTLTQLGPSIGCSLSL